MGDRRGGGGGHTSLMSVQCEPLPVKPAGQGPQRAPPAVMVQATPGKQKPGAHWGRGRTLRPGVCAGCIPAGRTWAVRTTPGGGAYSTRPGRGLNPSGPHPGPVLSDRSSLPPSVLVRLPLFPSASLHRPVPPARLLPLFVCPPPITSVSVPTPHPLSPSLSASFSSSSLSLPLSPSLAVSPRHFLLSRRPVSASLGPRTARVTLHHRVFQERDLLDLVCRGDGVWSAGLRFFLLLLSPPPLTPSPPLPSPLGHPSPVACPRAAPTSQPPAPPLPGLSHPSPRPDSGTLQPRPHLLPQQLPHVPQRRVGLLQFAQHLRAQVCTCTDRGR